MILTKDEDEILKTIGSNIKRERENLGWDIKQLSLKTNLTSGFLKRLESGEANPKVTIILRISKAFKIKLSDFWNHANN